MLMIYKKRSYSIKNVRKRKDFSVLFTLYFLRVKKIKKSLH